jgi:hypothetical protein
MSRISISMLGLALLLVILNFFFVQRYWWSLPVLIAVSASPVFRPNRWHLMIATGAALAELSVGFSLVPLAAQTTFSVIALGCALPLLSKLRM